MKIVMKITETLERTVIVDANSYEDARDKVEKAYDNEQIVLDYRDYNGYEINGIRVACPGDVEKYTEIEV